VTYGGIESDSNEFEQIDVDFVQNIAALLQCNGGNNAVVQNYVDNSKAGVGSEEGDLESVNTGMHNF
jgi:hypothetical protein